MTYIKTANQKWPRIVHINMRIYLTKLMASLNLTYINFITTPSSRVYVVYCQIQCNYSAFGDGGCGHLEYFCHQWAKRYGNSFFQTQIVYINEQNLYEKVTEPVFGT